MISNINSNTVDSTNLKGIYTVSGFTQVVYPTNIAN